MTKAVREKRFVKAKLEGKSNFVAAKEATGLVSKHSIKKIAHKFAQNPNIKVALAIELEKQGITLAVAVKPIKQALHARTGGHFERDDKGVRHYVSEIDHTTRLKASDRALELLGAKAAPGTIPSNLLPVDNAGLIKAISDGAEVKLQQVVFNGNKD